MRIRKKTLLFMITLQLLFCYSTKRYHNTERHWFLKNIEETARYIKTSLIKYFKDNNIYREDININCQRVRNITTLGINNLTFITALDNEFRDTNFSCNCEYFSYELTTTIIESGEIDRKNNRKNITFVFKIQLSNKKNKLLWKGKKVFHETSDIY